MKLPKINIDRILKQYLTLIEVYPKSIFVKSENYDPFRKEEVDNYSKTGHNYIPIKCYVRNASPEGLVIREIGLKAIGAKELWINKKYIELIKNAEKIIIENIEYTVWSAAVGNKFQIFERKGNLNLVEILIFRKEVE